MDENSSLFVFCLEMKPKEDSDEERKPSVVYSYPKEGNSLLDIEAMLVVLYNVMEDLTAKPANTSVLSCEEGKHLWVKYHKEGHRIVIFIVKSQVVCDKIITSLFQSIMHLVFVLYDSIENAFLRKKFHEKLDGIFSSAEEKLKNLFKSSSETILNLDFEYISIYTLPSYYQESIDKILSGLESKHPEHEKFRTEENCQHRRQFFLVGSCVFFNEFLLCNHLSPRHLEDVYVYLKFHRLFMQQTSQQIILWREIHLTKDKTQKDDGLGYTERPSQCYLLVVYQRPYFLATLLQSPKSLSGKNINDYSSTLPPSPPPLYIERLKATLSQIHSTILCFGESCRDNKECGKVKDLSFAGQITTFFKSSISKTKKSCNLEQNSTEYFGYADISNVTLSPTSIDTSKENSRTPLHSNPKYSSKLPSNSNSCLDKLQAQGFQQQMTPESHEHLDTKLNSLNFVNFTSLHSYYPCCYGVVAVLYLQAGEGQLSKGVHINGCCNVHPDIKAKISRCCIQIMAHFKDSKSFEKSSGRSTLVATHRTNRQRIREYGVFLKNQIPNEHKTKETENTDIWVVGKQICQGKGNVQQTVFICFRDLIEQSLIDLAFTLPFGHNWME